ncbi:MAG TPA: sigma-70 family RNA polymerase sigma factor [Polyangiaceae bacterium]
MTVLDARPLASAAPPASEGESEGQGQSAGARLTAHEEARVAGMVREHHAFVWRLLRRLGVPPSGTDDATQQVFLVAMRRVSQIALGSEKSFLFGVALRVASDERRSAKNRERPGSIPDGVAPLPEPEEAADASRRREILQQTLLEMPLELRTVFVLFELEQMTKTEVAALLELPVGTAVSRLRRAR